MIQRWLRVTLRGLSGLEEIEHGLARDIEAAAGLPLDLTSRLNPVFPDR